MKKLLFILFLTVSGGVLAQQDALNNSEVSIQCKDYLDCKEDKFILVLHHVKRQESITGVEEKTHFV